METLMQFKLLTYLFSILFLFNAQSAIGKAQNIRIAISSAPSNISYFYGTDANSQNINRLVHLSLTDFSKEMTFFCRFCESYSERMDGKKHVINFKLKKGIKFWDGQEIQAKDVVNSWQYLANNSVIKSKYQASFSSIENVIIKNNYEVNFVYKEFNVDNLSNLTLLKIVKINKDDITESMPADKVIGAGPYKFKRIDELEIVLESVSGTKPDLTFKVVKDETTLALKLINKEVDLSLANISPRKYMWLKNNIKDLSFMESEGTNYQYIGINHKNEFLKNREIRQALSLLIPREKISKYKLKDTVTLSSSMFSKAFADFYVGPLFDKYNPEKAREILSQQGFKKSVDGILKKGDKTLSLTWRVSNNKSAIETAESIKKYFEKEGIEINLMVQEWGTFMRNYKSGNFDMVMSQWVGFTGPGLLKYLFHSETFPPNGANRGFFVNSDFDKYINLATSEIDSDKRNEFYRKALKISNKEYSYLNLWHPNIIWIGRSCLQGIDVQPNGSFLPLLNVVDNCGK
jgi:peptide/nickel transport system substrate-binding protein